MTAKTFTNTSERVFVVVVGFFVFIFLIISKHIHMVKKFEEHEINYFFHFKEYFH